MTAQPTIADLAAELEPILERPENKHLLEALIDRLDEIYRCARRDGRWWPRPFEGTRADDSPQQPDAPPAGVGTRDSPRA